MKTHSVLDQVDQRTNLAGRNRLELLLFRLNSQQTYGLNVFKVREVISTSNITLVKIPEAPTQVIGSTHVRGKTISIIDLSQALGMAPILISDDSYIIITEFNRLVQGFLVPKVLRIVNTGWDKILPPPNGIGSSTYMTAVAKLDDTSFAEVIDVEKILAEILGLDTSVEGLLDAASGSIDEVPPILVVDDSSMAHKQITVTLDAIGIGYKRAWNGEEALEILQSHEASDFLMVIADIEMPKMDGYTLTRTLKDDPKFQGLYVVLHTSLSGIFNKSMVQKVGANAFLTKFSPNELEESVRIRIDKWREANAG